MPSKPRYYLTACAILRNEGRYIQEWLAFHAAAGVEHFYLYDNNSDDDMVEKILGFSHPEMVTLSPWPVHPGQAKAYTNALNTFGRDTTWMAFIDGDEFLFSTETPDLRTFLKQFEHRSALGVHWVIYGSSGHVKRPDGLQIESYLRRGEKDYSSNGHIKSIVQARHAIRPVNPHVFKLQEGDLVREDDEVITGTNGRLEIAPISNRIRINHYFGRSLEDWEAKVARGRATMKEQRPFEMFHRNDRNEIHDDAALKFRPLMERFLNPSALDRLKAALVTRPLAKLRYARRQRWVAAHPSPPGPAEGKKGPAEGKKGPAEGKKGPAEGKKGPAEGRKAPAAPAPESQK